MWLQFGLASLLLSGLLTVVVFWVSPDHAALRGAVSSSVAFPGHRRPLHPTNRPVIGILTQPTEFGGEYIAASYVKFVEASGARVVPIRYWWSERELQTVFRGINGVLLPGGGASLDPEDSVMIRPAQILYDLAQKQNKLVPNSFFLFGVCLGWEILAVVASKDATILKESGQYDNHGLAKPLQQVDFRSQLFRDLDSKLPKKKLFYHSHQMGVSPEMFRLKFDHCWKTVATGQDERGKRFIAAAESRCAPYYGLQFHPEKNLFEWKSGADIPHQLEATEVTLHFVRLLAELGRRTRQGNFNERDIFARAIENTPVVTVGDSYFFQVYNFTRE